jgi:hypothetical protein
MTEGRTQFAVYVNSRSARGGANSREKISDGAGGAGKLIAFDE